MLHLLLSLLHQASVCLLVAMRSSCQCQLVESLFEMFQMSYVFPYLCGVLQFDTGANRPRSQSHRPLSTAEEEAGRLDADRHLSGVADVGCFQRSHSSNAVVRGVGNGTRNGVGSGSAGVHGGGQGRRRKGGRKRLRRWVTRRKGGGEQRARSWLS